MTIENRPGGLVAGVVGSAGMLLPRMYPPWLLRTMAEDLEAMVTMFCLHLEVGRAFSELLGLIKELTANARCDVTKNA